MNQARRSGLLVTGGKNAHIVEKDYEFRQYGYWGDIDLTDQQSIVEYVPDYQYNPRHTNSTHEILLFAEKILLTDPDRKNANWLTQKQLKERYKREIYTAVGTPDPSVVSGMYWRTHPNGRKVNSDEQRQRNGASYFR